MIRFKKIVSEQSLNFLDRSHSYCNEVNYTIPFAIIINMKLMDSFHLRNNHIPIAVNLTNTIIKIGSTIHN